MKKDIEEEKIKRFVRSHTKMLGPSPEQSKSTSPCNLELEEEKKNEKETSKEPVKKVDICVSISPSRSSLTRSNKGGFTIKPTTVNHFTGEKLTPDDPM